MYGNNKYSEFIPYACHIDKETIVTTNDILLKTIVFSSTIDDIEHFRQKLRDFLSQYYLDTLSIYFHTVKLKSNINVAKMQSYNIEDIIATKMAQTCKFSLDTDIAFYITICSKVDSIGRTTFTYNSAVKMHNHNLAKSSKILTLFSDKLLQTLAEYNPIMLGIIEQDGTYISQNMTFLSILTNLNSEIFEIPAKSIAEAINHSSYKFAKNKAMISNEKGNKYFKLFSIKEYSDVSSDAIYRMLHSIDNIIISQVAIPISNKIIAKEYQEVAKIYSVSDDQDFISNTSLVHLGQALSNPDKKVYVKSQINVLVGGESIEIMEKSAKLVTEIFSKIGIVSFLEDVNLENSFFSMIPGNFRFLYRTLNIPIASLCGFVCAEGYSDSRNTNFMWNTHLVMLQKASNHIFLLGMPLEQRNLLILGHENSGKSTLANLMLAGCIKNDINVLYLDTKNNSDCFARLCGIDVININNDKAQFIQKINPFSNLGPKRTHLDFAKLILKILLGKSKQSSLDSEIESLAHAILANPSEAKIAIEKSTLIQNVNLSEIINGKYSGVFDFSNNADHISDGKSIRIVISEEVQHVTHIADAILINFLFRLIPVIQSNKNVMIVINDIFQLCNTKSLAQILEQVLIKAREKSKISFLFISNNENPEIIKNSMAYPIIMKHCEHKIHFANRNIENIPQYSEVFNLDKKDINNISNLDREAGRSFALFTPYKKEYIKFNFSELINDMRIISDASQTADKATKLILSQNPGMNRGDLYQQVIEKLEYTTDDSDPQEESIAKKDILDGSE